MRKTLKIRSRTIPIIWLLIAIIITTTVVSALVIFGTMQIGYTITAETPALTPSTVNLDLGSIPSGSSGTKDFTKVATLSLPVSYEITFTLDLATTEHFSIFTVCITLWKSGETSYSAQILLYNDPSYPNTDSRTLDAGTYEVDVNIVYTAKSVTTTTGNVKIDISYPAG